MAEKTFYLTATSKGCFSGACEDLDIVNSFPQNTLLVRTWWSGKNFPFLSGKTIYRVEYSLYTGSSSWESSFSHNFQCIEGICNWTGMADNLEIQSHRLLASIPEMALFNIWNKNLSSIMTSRILHQQNFAYLSGIICPNISLNFCSSSDLVSSCEHSLMTFPLSLFSSSRLQLPLNKAYSFIAASSPLIPAPPTTIFFYS